jgi:membrane protease YdiL (CAAX protease family)
MEKTAGFWAIKIIFGVAVATALGILAHNKRKSVIGWVLLGFFLPLIAIIVAGLRSVAGGWDRPRRTERKCPHCLNVVDMFATKCGKCRGDLPSVFLPKREDGGIDCPVCNGRNVRREIGGYYCDFCNRVVAQLTEYGPRIEDDLLPKKEKREPPVHVEITTAHESPAKEEVIKQLTPLEPTKDEVKTLKADQVTGRTPSLETVVLMPLIYLFGLFPIAFVLGPILRFFGTTISIPGEKLDSVLKATTTFVTFLFCLLVTIFLVKRYSAHFFSGSWKNNLYSRCWVGLKWSILFIVFAGIDVLSPETRAVSLERYLLTNKLSLENITPIIVILISASMLVGSFLEELIFRGMIQQYIKKFVTPRKSVLITAGIFALAHFGIFFSTPVSLIPIGFSFLVGIFTGFAFNKSNSCISSFIPHLVYNLNYIIIVPLILMF